MRRTAAGFLAAALVCLSGCAWIFPDMNSDTPPTQSSEVVEKYWDEYRDKWQYGQLDNRLKSAYEEVYASLRESFGVDESVTIKDENDVDRNYDGLRIRLTQALRSRSEAERLYTALLWDNPRFFYIGIVYSYLGQRSGSAEYFDVFCLTYTMNAEERARAAESLDGEVQRLVDAVYDPENPADQFDMELALHDALLERCTYDRTITGDAATDSKTAYSAYGALVEGRAVCEGYARAMQLLLHEVGIECTLVSGTHLETGVAHMWNFLKIGDYTYHLDPTWNDDNDRIHHTYFNVNTQTIQKTHEIGDENVGITSSTATQAQYYRKTGHYLKSGQLADIAGVIAEGIRGGATYVDLQFSEESFQSALNFLRNSSVVIMTVDALLKDSGNRMFEYSTVTERPVQRTVTIYKGR